MMIKAFHDKHIVIKSFIPCQKVLLFSSRLHIFLGELCSRWFGYITFTFLLHMGLLKLRIQRNPTFKVNGQR